MPAKRAPGFCPNTGLIQTLTEEERKTGRLVCACGTKIGVAKGQREATLPPHYKPGDAAKKRSARRRGRS